MPLSGWLRYPAAWWRARARPNAGAALDRAGGDRLAAAADPLGLVGSRARARGARRPGSHGGPARVLSFEDNEFWAEQTRSRLQELGLENVELRQRPVERFAAEVDDPAGCLLRPGRDGFPGGPGVTRIDVLKPAMKKVRPGGYLLLDDSDRPGYAEAFELLDGLALPEVRRRQGRLARGLRDRHLPASQIEEAPCGASSLASL